MTRKLILQKARADGDEWVNDDGSPVALVNAGAADGDEWVNDDGSPVAALPTHTAVSGRCPCAAPAPDDEWETLLAPAGNGR